MERDLAIRTPESITLRYELAGLGSRFLAVFADLVLQILVVVIVAIVAAILHVRQSGITAALHLPAAAANAVLLALAIAGIFVVFFGYFIVAEWRFNGRTIGKRLVGIRVVRDGGAPIDPLAAIIRNFVRVIEAGLFFYGISAIVTLVSKENKRLGDYAAGTIVVRDAKMHRAALRYDPAAAANDPLPSAERILVDRYLERRSGLSREARTRIAAEIAARVRPLMPAIAAAEGDDDAFLVRAATTRT